MKKSFIYMALVAFMFTACEADELTNKNVETDTSKFTIEGYVIDGDGNVPLKDVEVQGAFGMTKTDEKGFFKVTDLNHGEYSIIFKKSTFGSMIQTFTLEAVTDQAVDVLNVDYTASTRVSMFKLKSSLETTLWKTTNNKREVLANVPFTIYLTSPGLTNVLFLNNKITGTTTAEGKIMVTDSLPNSSVQIVVNHVDEVANKVYKLDHKTIPSAALKNYDVASQAIADDLYVLTSNIFDVDGVLVTNFPISQSITFNFNLALDAKTTATLTNLSDGKSVAANYSISGKTLTIDPIGDLYKSKNFQVNIKPVSGAMSLSKVYTFTTEGAITSLAQVVGLSLKSGTVIAITSTTAPIEFSKIKDVDYYEVYAKYGTQTEYQLLTQKLYPLSGVNVTREEYVLFMDGALANMNAPVTGMFDNGNKFTIIVRAKLGSVYGAFSDPLVIQKTL